MAHIDYYLTTLSPFAYMAGQRLEEIADRHNASITYKPLDIMALFSRTGGSAPKDRHPSRLAYRVQELQRLSKKLETPVNLKPAHWPTNPAPSSFALISAQNAGGGDLGLLCHSFLRACWAEDKDIAEESVVAQCLEAAGFDPALATANMLTAADTYAANLEDAVKAGVFGAPFYVVDSGQLFWGQDSLADLDLHLSGAF